MKMVFCQGQYYVLFTRETCLIAMEKHLFDVESVISFKYFNDNTVSRTFSRFFYFTIKNVCLLVYTTRIKQTY